MVILENQLINIHSKKGDIPYGYSYKVLSYGTSLNQNHSYGYRWFTHEKNAWSSQSWCHPAAKKIQELSCPGITWLSVPWIKHSGPRRDLDGCARKIVSLWHFMSEEYERIVYDIQMIVFRWGYKATYNWGRLGSSIWSILKLTEKVWVIWCKSYKCVYLFWGYYTLTRLYIYIFGRYYRL